MLINRVLCAVDFSECSRRALHHARAIATWYEADLHVLHAFQGRIPANLPGLAALPPMSTVDFRPATERALETLVFVNDAGPATRVVRDGPAPATILEYAHEVNADLIVLGSHGWSGLDRLILGSTADRVVRHADSPVLTIPRQADEPGAADGFRLTHVLCAVDFSPPSLEALERGVSLARENRARLTLLHVTEPAEHPPFADEHDSSAEHVELRMQRAVQELAATAPASARDWGRMHAIVRPGQPAAVILSEADLGDVDLIVMGSQGRHGVGLALFGSTTQTVIRGARCPVLTARTKHSSPDVALMTVGEAQMNRRTP